VGGKGGGRGGVEMTQTLYGHMNKKKKLILKYLLTNRNIFQAKKMCSEILVLISPLMWL
jgi:hypothetical protein